MKKGKRAVCCILSLLLAVSFVACAKSGGDSEKKEADVADNVRSTTVPKSDKSGEGSGKNDKEEAPAKISILLSGDNTPSADNLVLKELGKRTNTIIDMTYVPGSDLKTKKSTLAASGTLPDIFGTDGDEALEFREGGLLAEVGDLVEQYAPNVLDNVGENLSKSPVNEDGIYMILTAKLPYCKQLNLRTDWLANLKMDMPTDPDSLYDVLYAFTFKDPDGNGKNDTFGLCANADPLSFASVFGAYNIPVGKAIELEDGAVTSWVKHPKFLEAMAYINKLNRDGLIEPEWATVPQMDMFSKLWNGVAGGIEWECVGPTNNWMPSRYTEETPPTFDFPVIKGPEGYHGTPAAMPSLTTGYAFSSKCKNLESAVKLANFCMSEEGSELLYLGVENVMFKWTDKANGGYEYLGEYKDNATHRAAGGFVYWSLFAPAMNAEIETFNRQTREGVALARENGIPYVNIVQTLETRTELGADMDQTIDEMYVDLVAADGDLKPIYDSYIKEWEEIGGKEWEEEATEAWKGQDN